MDAAPSPSTSLSLVDEIRQLSQSVNELEGAFRRQRETLKKSGMSLPPGTLAGLQAIYTDLDGVANKIAGNLTELAQLRALSQTGQLINSTLNIDEVLNGVMEAVVQLTHAERGYLVLRNAESGEMEFRVARSISGNLREGEFIISSTIVREVARTGIPVVTNDAGQDQRWEATQSVIGFALRSVLCVPLLLRGQVTGVIYADNRAKRGIFGDKERELLYAFANQAAVAIENARLFESARATLDEVSIVKNLMDNVFASIGSGVITTDAEHRITMLNDAAERILSIVRQSGLGQLFWQVFPPLTQDFDERVRAVFEQNAQAVVEAEPFLSDRGRVNLTLKLSPLRDVAETTQGVAIVVDDMTEIKARDAQLRAVRRYLPPAMVDNIHSIDQLGLGGERRETTIMYVDVRSFSTFPPGLRAQEVMQMLNDYLTVASDEVSQQNGVIDKYMANEVMALFNSQLNPDDDHAYKAVLSALNMADQYRAFYSAHGEPEDMPYYRVGIHTGIVTMGNAGSKTRKEFTAIGDSVNVAHRILENSPTGQILISREAYHHCRTRLEALGNVEVIGRGQINVKGRQQAVEIYEVRRDVSHG